MTNGALLLVRLVLSVSFCALLTWIGWKLGQRPWALVAFLVSCPFIAWAIARPLIEVVHEGFDWLSQHPLKKWEGNYYAFNNVQVRVYVEMARMWFAIDDVLTATDTPGKANLVLVSYPDNTRLVEGVPCIDIDGIDKLMAARGTTELGKLSLWARREVIAPWQKKKGSDPFSGRKGI